MPEFLTFSLKRMPSINDDLFQSMAMGFSEQLSEKLPSHYEWTFQKVLGRVEVNRGDEDSELEKEQDSYYYIFYYVYIFDLVLRDDNQSKHEIERLLDLVYAIFNAFIDKVIYLPNSSIPLPITLEYDFSNSRYNN